MHTLHQFKEKCYAYIGKKHSGTDTVLVSQDRINDFADTTLDHQFIHIDQEKARKTPFGKTIAHGFLVLSLTAKISQSPLPRTLLQNHTQMMINYGLNKVRFLQPVLSGSTIRADTTLLSVDMVEKKHALKLTHSIEIFSMDSPKPVAIAESLLLVIVAP